MITVRPRQLASAKYILVVPPQRLTIGPIQRRNGRRKQRAVQAAILTAVIKISLYSLADYKPILVVNCYVARVKNTMDVTSKKNAIRKFVRSTECIRLI